MIARLIVDLLLIGVSFCWGLKNGMEYTEKKYREKNHEDN